MKILVGSANPVKIESAKIAFSKFFNDVEVIGVKVQSQVSDQPANDETFRGAENRACALKKINEEQQLNADFFIGIEGGIAQRYKKWFSAGIMCIINKDGKKGFGMSPHFEVPQQFVKELLSGTELGHLADRISGDKNVKQKGGMISILTKNVLSRTDLYVPGLITALVPFVNEELYFGSGEN